jgi:predicted CopG family antitoxin
MTTTINLKIPFESLSEVINSLDLSQKQQLLEILEQQIFEEEEASYQDDDETLAELQKVRDEYQSGEYVTLEQYLNKD